MTPLNNEQQQELHNATTFESGEKFLIIKLEDKFMSNEELKVLAEEIFDNFAEEISSLSIHKAPDKNQLQLNMKQ